MKNYQFFDSHAHYHDARFMGEDPSLPPVERLLQTLFKDTVGHIMDVGTDLETSKQAIAMAMQYPGMFAAIGMYPGSCPLSERSRETMDGILNEFRTMLSHQKVAAIGEIGFDFHYDTVPRDMQEIWFDRQMQLAEESGYPVIIHNREAHQATLELLKRYPTVHGVLHSYSGSAEMAEELLRMGYYISVSGVVTFKNARRIQEVVQMLPADRLLIETDCPYLTPVPHRGTTNHSGYLIHTVEKIAELRQTEPDSICRASYDNACRLFRINPVTNMKEL